MGRTAGTTNLKSKQCDDRLNDDAKKHDQKCQRKPVMERTGESESAPANHPTSSAAPLAAIHAPVSLGELLDKITILEIKEKHFQGPSLDHVQHELKELQMVLASLPITPDPQLLEQLRSSNRALWRIEDGIRAKEQAQDFGKAFIELARSVYRQNDRRSAIKRQLNLLHGSTLIEEKLYTPY